MKIEPGQELDQAVARAIGITLPRPHDWEATGLVDYENSVYRCRKCGDLEMSDMGKPEFDESEDPCVPPYSTDMNAAFKAAEAVDLFEPTKPGAIVMQVEEGWLVLWRGPHAAKAIGGTPALAICAAILKLKEDKCN